MSTRCKPGDLAYVSGGGVPEVLGRFVTVVGPFPGPVHGAQPGVVYWDVSPRMFDPRPPRWGLILAFADHTLTPIRPGDFDKDESTPTPTETSCTPQQVPTPERIET